MTVLNQSLLGVFVKYSSRIQEGPSIFDPPRNANVFNIFRGAASPSLAGSLFCKLQTICKTTHKAQRLWGTKFHTRTEYQHLLLVDRSSFCVCHLKQTPSVWDVHPCRCQPELLGRANLDVDVQHGLIILQPGDESLLYRFYEMVKKVERTLTSTQHIVTFNAFLLCPWTRPPCSARPSCHELNHPGSPAKMRRALRYRPVTSGTFKTPFPLPS